jgi:hypothetical protein
VNDPLAGYEGELAPERLSGRVLGLELSVEPDDRGRALAYLGLYDRLGVRTSERLGAEAPARLQELRLRIGSLEGALRYEAWELSAETEALGRAERLTSRESRLKQGWLVPRLREEIALYRLRIDALERALGSG